LVSGVDLYRFFDALVPLAPPNSHLGLAKGAWPRPLRRLLVERASPIDRETLLSLPAEFAKAKFLPVRPDLMSHLTSMAEHLAEPEIAISLVVFAQHSPLLEWYDVPANPLAIAGHLAEELVARFCAETGARYERAEPNA